MAGDLDELERLSRAAYEEARQAIFGLRSMVAGDRGLVPSLTEYVEEWSRQIGVEIDLKVTPGEDLALSPAVEVQLIGILQEALANVRKHARARRVRVGLEQEGGPLRLSISDDGVGFDPEAVAGRGASFGLTTMRERAEAVGARLTVASSPARGTRVEVEFPAAGPTRGRP